MIEIAVGDIVVYFDRSLPEKSWDVGRGVLPSEMGVVRAVHPGGLVDVQLGVTPDHLVKKPGKMTLKREPDGDTKTRVPHKEAPDHVPSWDLIV